MEASPRSKIFTEGEPWDSIKSAYQSLDTFDRLMGTILNGVFTSGNIRFLLGIRTFTKYLLCDSNASRKTLNVNEYKQFLAIWCTPGGLLLQTHKASTPGERLVAAGFELTFPPLVGFFETKWGIEHLQAQKKAFSKAHGLISPSREALQDASQSSSPVCVTVSDLENALDVENETKLGHLTIKNSASRTKAEASFNNFQGERGNTRGGSNSPSGDDHLLSPDEYKIKHIFMPFALLLKDNMVRNGIRSDDDANGELCPDERGENDEIDIQTTVKQTVAGVKISKLTLLDHDEYVSLFDGSLFTDQPSCFNDLSDFSKDCFFNSYLELINAAPKRGFESI